MSRHQRLQVPARNVMTTTNDAVHLGTLAATRSPAVLDLCTHLFPTGRAPLTNATLLDANCCCMEHLKTMHRLYTFELA